MGGSILEIGRDDLAAHKTDTFKHTVALRNKVFPVIAGRIMDVCHHDLVHRSSKVGEQIDPVAVRLHGQAGILHVGGHLHELRTLDPQILHIEVVTDVGTVFVEEGESLLFVDFQLIETQGLGGIAEIEFILALGSADFVIVNLVDLVLAAELVAIPLRSVVGTVVKTVAAPGSPGKLGPHYMVFKQAAILHIHHENFFPVAAAAGNHIGHVLAVVREIGALESHRAVVAEGIGIQEDAGLAAEFVHLVEDALVLESVVLVEIPFAVLLVRGRAHLFVVGDFLEPREYLFAGGKLFKIGPGHFILRLDPGGSLGGSVVFQPTIWIGDLRAEVIVDSIVFARLGKFGRAGFNCNSSHCQNYKDITFHRRNIGIF